MNNLKTKMRNGETILGLQVSTNLDKTQLERHLETGEYSFIWVESQHAPLNEERLVEFCKEATELAIPVLFRIRHTSHTYLVGNYLDLGPTGVEVPQVESEQTVDEAIANFYYPRVGSRSWGGQTRLGLDKIPDVNSYAEWWANTGVLWMQVESISAVTKARTLAKNGVDCLSFGPADLLFSIESNPDQPLQSVDDCVKFVVNELSDSDVAVCYRSYDRASRQKYLDMGVTVLIERP